MTADRIIAEPPAITGNFSIDYDCDWLANKAVELDLESIALGVPNLLLKLAKQRPDLETFEDLIADSETHLEDHIRNVQLPEASLIISDIFRRGVLPWADSTCRQKLDMVIRKIEAPENAGDEMLFVECITELVGATYFLNDGVKPSTVVLEADEIHVGRNARISFQRTLRVPMDGERYPLPEGLGRLPIYRVEDYADTVPESWLQSGGFFIPLYQCEAVFLNFSGADWHPNILKVAVGGINAVTGHQLSESLDGVDQDYVVIPDQKWLDGINKDKGTVQQFVAMPLGEGFTVEEQLTDECSTGGIQVIAYEPVPGRFAERIPFVDHSKGLGLAAADRPMAMGVAAGGQIEQQIVADEYGRDSWDVSRRTHLKIHLVNSGHFESITGIKPPPTPITQKVYAELGLPWYSAFDEFKTSIKAAARFKGIKGIDQIKRIRGCTNEDSADKPDFGAIIRRIHTPTQIEREAQLIQRLEDHWKAKRFHQAQRVACQLLDLNPSHKEALKMRAKCYSELGRYNEACEDAAEWIARWGKDKDTCDILALVPQMIEEDCLEEVARVATKPSSSVCEGINMPSADDESEKIVALEGEIERIRSEAFAREKDMLRQVSSMTASLREARRKDAAEARQKLDNACAALEHARAQKDQLKMLYDINAKRLDQIECILSGMGIKVADLTIGAVIESTVDNSAPLGDVQVELPKDRLEKMVIAASSLLAADVKNPRELIRRLEALAPNGDLRKYARSFWRVMTAFDTTLEVEPDWVALYELEKRK